MNNNFNLWFILAVAAISLLQWLARKAKEQQNKNQQRRVRQQAEDETLRTGRAPPTRQASAPSSHDVQQARLRELAEMRRRQLEELRRQQREAATKKRGPVVRTSGVPGAPPARIPGGRLPTAGPMSSGPIVRPAPVARSTAAPRSAPRGVTQKPSRSRPAPPKAGTLPVDTMLKASLKATPLDLPADSAREAAGGYSRLSGAPGLDWRRAIVFAEVLGTPVGLRPPSDPTDRGW